MRTEKEYLGSDLDEKDKDHEYEQVVKDANRSNGDVNRFESKDVDVCKMKMVVIIIMTMVIVVVLEVVVVLVVVMVVMVRSRSHVPDITNHSSVFHL